jgi:CBS-domain-containing membrane protein
MSTTSSSRSGPQSDLAWSRPLRDFPGLVHLAPPVNRPEDALAAVIETFSRDHGAGAVFVVDAEDHLLGCIPEQALDADLVTVVLPQRLWPAIREMDTRDVLRAARAPRLKAGDLMVGVRSVNPNTSLTDAVGQMVRAQQSTAPLLDEQDRLLGYIRLFELLAHFLRTQ